MSLYEHPFNEHVRTYLRLEHLYARLEALVARETPLDHHFALVTLFDIMEATNRPDLKSHVLNALEKQKSFLAGFRNQPGVSNASLDATLRHLAQVFRQLQDQQGKPGQDLAGNEWLMAIRNRLPIPGGTCSFDLPSYAAWQRRDAASRHKNLQDWSASLRPMEAAITLLLQLLRSSTDKAQMMVADKGVLQLKVPRSRSVQLLRLELADTLPLVPEISGNQLLLSIRLMHPTPTGALQATTDDTPIKITLCA
ncbi:MAG: cell division protein ZapD [Ottowia sp.]|nr:cell division protein ZapD [Ottowia sp.]